MGWVNERTSGLYDAVTKPIESVINNPIVQGVTDIATSGASSPYFAASDLAQGNVEGAALQGIAAYGSSAGGSFLPDNVSSALNLSTGSADALGIGSGFSSSGIGSVFSPSDSGVTIGNAGTGNTAGITSTPLPSDVGSSVVAPISSGAAGNVAGVNTGGVAGSDIWIDPATGLPASTQPINLANSTQLQGGAPNTLTTGAGTGAADATGQSGLFGNMSTAQKVALGLQGANTAASLLAAKPSTSAQQMTDPYGTGATAATTANNLLTSFNNGTISPTSQASIAQYQQQQTAAIKAQYAAQGLSGSSMEAQALSGVGLQAQQMQQMALNNMLTQATTAANITSPYVTNMVTQQVANNKALQTAQTQFGSLLAQYGIYSMGS